ncbi:hypothetical protein FHW77_003968 [Agrobacterium sp. RC10-4-1]|nr:hypothetical protein [Agrobacterium sp. RC10-4-1]
MATDIGSKAVIIDGFLAGLLAGGEQGIKLAAVEMIIFMQNFAKTITLAFRDGAIGFHDLKTEGGYRHPQIIGTEITCLRADEVLNKRLYLLEHR